MQSHLYRLTFFLAVFTILSVCSPAHAEIRNFFTVSSIDYDGIGESTVVENTSVVKFHPRISALVRLYHDNRASWDNSIATIGPVINIGKHSYAELTYGYGRDSDSRRADYFSAELVREMPSYLAGIGMMYRSYPSYTYTTLSPSLKYRINKKLALWGKYFASIDSDNNFDHAYWTDIEYSVTGRVHLTLGYTGGNRLYSPEYENLLLASADMSFYSVIGQVSYMLNDRLTVKYLHERVTRQSKFDDLKHVFLLDMRL